VHSLGRIRVWWSREGTPQEPLRNPAGNEATRRLGATRAKECDAGGGYSHGCRQPKGKRVPIPAASAAEYRELRRSLRNALERAVAFSDGWPIPPRDRARGEDSDGPPEALKGLADSLEAAQVKLFKALRPPHKVRSVATHGEEKVLNGRRPMDARNAKTERPGVNDQPPRLQSRKPKP
jgi:hypothetical protein